jgi:hypothetical protein
MTDKELKKLTAEYERQAKIQQQVSSSYQDYLKGVQDYKKILTELKRIDKERAILQRELAKGNVADVEAAKKKLAILDAQTDKIKEQGIELENALKKVNKASLAGAEAAGKVLKGLTKDFLGVPNAVKTAFGKIQNLGLFDMDKAVKQSALQMGLLDKQTKGYTSSIRLASDTTNGLGIDIKQLAKMQASYSEELGRTVMLGQSGLIAMGEMAAATGLGAEGAAKMAAEMEVQGLSAERTRDYIEQTMNDSSKMGTNATKVVKNIQNNIKMLNKYNFKDGVKGLGKMAQLVSKLGVDMNFATGFADKLWNIEGAVDMSAQLQVMGGEWSKLADPFKLMYMARNDMEGLTEQIAKAAESSARFDEATGEFKIGAMEMHKLKVIAEQTGMSYDDLTTAAKNAAKFTEIKSQIKYDVAGDKDMKEFIENTAKLDENKKAYIEIDGNPKYLSDLKKSDLIKQMNEKKSLAERAKSAQSFDESFTNLVNLLKTNMLPIVDGLNEGLKPLIEDIFKNKEFKTELKDLGKNIGSVVKTGAEVVKTIAELAVQFGPTGLLASYLGVKGLGLLMDMLKWKMNGKYLAQGFNSMASVGGGMGSSSPWSPSQPTGLNKKGGSTKGKRGLINTLGNNKMSKGILGAGKGIGGMLGKGAGMLGKGFGKSLLKKIPGLGLIAGLGFGVGRAMDGDWLGALGEVGSGAASTIPGLGTLASTGIDAALMARDVSKGEDIGDGVFGGLKTKKRAVIQGGKVHAIDNKDDLLAMKPGGVVDKTMNNSGASSVTHVFEPITINGEIIIKTPGDSSISIDLLKDAQFKRDITQIIQVEVEKTKNGGKNRG